MNADIAEGKWKQLKGQVQQIWGDLTDDEFDRIAGRRTEFVGILQKNYGETKEDAESAFDALRTGRL